jgi:uridylate kinase
MYFNIHCGCSSHPWDSPLRGLRSVSLPAKRSCAPAGSRGQGVALLGAPRTQRDLPSLATVFSQPLRPGANSLGGPTTCAQVPAYRRVLIKMSGEALMGASDYGIDPDVIQRLAEEVKDLVICGIQVGIVIGGGNLLRGQGLAAKGMDRVTADQMGMLGTLINALALQDALERIGLYARVMSAIRVHQICEEYIRRRAVRHLEKGRVVVFAAGTGNPFFTTDSAASLRAIEIDADLMIKATKVDGVYSSDPRQDRDARRYEHLDYDQVLMDRLGVMDATAVVLCRDNAVPLRVLDMTKPGAMMRAVMGEPEGTLVTSTAHSRKAR